MTLSFHQSVNVHRYVENHSDPFVYQLTEDERLYGYFQQDGATAPTT